MVILVVVLHVIASLFLIAVILLQAGRGQGLSWGVFGGTPQSILGTKTASFLSRVTTGCAIIFLFTCITLNIIETRKSRSLITPQKPISQLDFSKIKDALEQAEKDKTKSAATTEGQAKVISQEASTAIVTNQASVQTQTKTETQSQTQAPKDQVALITPQEKSTLPIDEVPPPPEKH